jgi:RNA polymerase-binding transcription factor DksA
MAKKITRDELLTKQHQLIERVTAIKEDFERGLDPDLEEQAIQLENYEVLQKLLEQANAELDKIDEQLKKMSLTSSPT